MEGHPKRFFGTASEVCSALAKMRAHERAARGQHEGNEIPRALGEKIMIAVSRVNECARCSYLHTRFALERGVPDSEVRALCSGEDADLTDGEAVVVAYAQHWADSGGEPSPEARARMIERHGAAGTIHAELIAHRVHVGNMMCNTVEAFRSGAGSGRCRLFRAYLLCAPAAFFIGVLGARGRRFLSGQKESREGS